MPKETETDAEVVVDNDVAANIAADADLVAVTKDGETLMVHPTTVAAHTACGWTAA